MTDRTAPDAEPTDLKSALIELRHAREEITRLRPFVDMVDQVQRDADAAAPSVPADRAVLVDLAAATCSAQNRNYESGPRLCIRAAQHHGDHIDEHGFHWSDTVAVYPLADGQFRTGINVRAALRRRADEAQQPTCPGYETTPNRCTCDCEGCKHHCAAHQADEAQQPETQAEVVHACPPDGSGITPCCGRTPFELPLTDRISSEAPITCPAAVSQPGKEATQ